MNKFAELNTFVVVVDAGGMSEAARRLGVSKSVVSQRIQLLERRLKSTLLERANKVRITPAGRHLYERAIHILAELADAEEAVQSTGAEFGGNLRVAAPMVFGLRYLSPILTQFAKRHPDLRLDVEASDSWVNLQDENFDLALRIGTPPDSSLIAKTIVENRQVICASPDYLAQRGVPLHPSDLETHDGLLYSYREPSGHWRLLADGQLQMFRIRGRLRTDSGFQLLDAAREGLGLAILPAFLAAEAIVAGELKVVLQDFTPDGGWISAIYRKSKRGSMKIHALVQFIREHLGNPPSWDIAIRDVQNKSMSSFGRGRR